MQSYSCDVLVIGAGPAGSISAATLQKAGFSVHVVEREKFPRFVIGESLLPRCMEVLDECDLLETVKNKKFQEKSGAKFVKGERVADYNFSDQFTDGWTWTWQVPRAEFDHTLIEAVAQRGVRVDFESTVMDVQFNVDGTSQTKIETASGETFMIQAKYIVDASGYGRVLPRLLHLDEPSLLTPRKAVFAHVTDIHRSKAHEPNRITIVNHSPDIWSWIIPFSSGTTSLGFVGSPERINNTGTNPQEQFHSLIDELPYLKERFGDAATLFAPRQLEAWSTKTNRFFGNGFVLTGNVTEFLDPIFSSGVMFAIVSGHLASKTLIRQLNGEGVNWQTEYVDVLQKGIHTFRTFVNAWYDGTLEKIFYQEKQDPLYKSQICSVLAGYVWDEANPFVRKPEASLHRLSRLIDLENQSNLSS